MSLLTSLKVLFCLVGKDDQGLILLVQPQQFLTKLQTWNIVFPLSQYYVCGCLRKLFRLNSTIVTSICAQFWKMRHGYCRRLTRKRERECSPSLKGGVRREYTNLGKWWCRGNYLECIKHHTNMSSYYYSLHPLTSLGIVKESIHPPPIESHQKFAQIQTFRHLTCISQIWSFRYLASHCRKNKKFWQWQDSSSRPPGCQFNVVARRPWRPPRSQN